MSYRNWDNRRILCHPHIAAPGRDPYSDLPEGGHPHVFVVELPRFLRHFAICLHRVVGASSIVGG